MEAYCTTAHGGSEMVDGMHHLPMPLVAPVTNTVLFLKSRDITLGFRRAAVTSHGQPGQQQWRSRQSPEIQGAVYRAFLAGVILSFITCTCMLLHTSYVITYERKRLLQKVLHIHLHVLDMFLNQTYCS